MRTYWNGVTRRTALVVLALGALGGVGVSAAISAGNPSPRVSVPGCRTSQLVVWLDTSGNGAAGSTYYSLEFTNLGSSSCAIRGYPGVSAVDLSGHQVGSSARRSPATSARVVSLAPNQSAIANVQITNVENYPRATCRPTTAAGLRVYPPDQTVSRLVPFPFGACKRVGVSYLGIQRVKPGGRRARP